jgi:mannose-1-phosphate guanylyltransferase
MQAMILAAGFGTRLQPYSLIRPKPLFPVLNRPLLLATIDRLKNAGFSLIVVNCHHLRQQIVSAVKDIPGVIVQEEPLILGTGGGLALAARSLNNEPLLVTNGDIYHSIDFAALYEHHIQSGNKVTMALHDHPRFNKIKVLNDQVLELNGSGETADLLAFTGLQVVSPELLGSLSCGTYSCIIGYYSSLIEKGVEINCRIETESNWTDMGTPEDYLALHQELLEGAIPIWPELNYLGTSPILVDERARCGVKSSFQQWASIGRARVGDDVQLKRSIVWDDAEVESGSRISDRIIVPI